MKKNNLILKINQELNKIKYRSELDVYEQEKEYISNEISKAKQLLIDYVNEEQKILDAALDEKNLLNAANENINNIMNSDLVEEEKNNKLNDEYLKKGKNQEWFINAIKNRSKKAQESLEKARNLESLNQKYIKINAIIEKFNKLHPSLEEILNTEETLNEILEIEQTINDESFNINLYNRLRVKFEDEQEIVEEMLNAAEKLIDKANNKLENNPKNEDNINREIKIWNEVLNKVNNLKLEHEFIYIGLKQEEEEKDNNVGDNSLLDMYNQNIDENNENLEEITLQEESTNEETNAEITPQEESIIEETDEEISSQEDIDTNNENEETVSEENEEIEAEDNLIDEIEKINIEEVYQEENIEEEKNEEEYSENQEKIELENTPIEDNSIENMEGIKIVAPTETTVEMNEIYKDENLNDINGDINQFIDIFTKYTMILHPEYLNFTEDEEEFKKNCEVDKEYIENNYETIEEQFSGVKNVSPNASDEVVLKTIIENLLIHEDQLKCKENNESIIKTKNYKKHIEKSIKNNEDSMQNLSYVKVIRNEIEKLKELIKNTQNLNRLVIDLKTNDKASQEIKKVKEHIGKVKDLLKKSLISKEEATKKLRDATMEIDESIDYIIISDDEYKTIIDLSNDENKLSEIVKVILGQIKDKNKLKYLNEEDLETIFTFDQEELILISIELIKKKFYQKEILDIKK